MQKLKLKEIYLYNPKTDKQVSFKVGKLNGNRFNELVQLDSKFRNVKREANLLFMVAQQSEEMLMEEFKRNPEAEALHGIIKSIAKGEIGYDEVISAFESRSSDIFKSNIERRIEVIKAMVDKESIQNEELVEMFYSEPSSEFWQSQDMEEVVEFSDYFRSKLHQ